MSRSTHICDVAIIGAGLAGASLALQLRAARPSLAISVFERNSLPPPAAAHKVGESTVEIGSHYLAHTLQLKGLLEQTQLRKFGLRFFFDAGSKKDFATSDELGASDFFSTTSYQLDRGTLEGSLADLMHQRDIELHADTRVVAISLANGTGQHMLTTRNAEQEQHWHCRFVVDAGARASLLSRQLKMARKVQHRASAAWFRLDSVIAVDDWSQQPEWQERCNGRPRRLSTNHLMGCGYWLWIIPLAGGRTSIGLVTDPDIHPVEQFNTLAHFLAWTRKHQPAMAARLEALQHSVMDFHFLRDLARDSGKAWSDSGSGSGWAMAGEAGVFADPFYSPGTDYIGIGNGFISDLIARESSKAERLHRSTLFNGIYRSFFSSTMSLYQQQYAGFGDTRLMAVKSTWDYAFYWSVLAWMFFRDIMTNLDFMQSCEPDFRAMQNLNTAMQALFRKRAAERIVSAGQGRFIDQKAIPILPMLNQALLEPGADLLKELRDNRCRLETVAKQLQRMLHCENSATLANCSLLGDLGKRLA